MTTTLIALLCGALVGAGVSMVIAALVRTRPDLATTVHQLLPPPGAPTPRRDQPAGAAARGWLLRVAVPMVADRLPLQRYSADLRILGQTVEGLATSKLGYAVLGAAFPPLLSALLLLLGVHAPVVVPVAAGLALAAGLFWLPDLTLRREAKAARAVLRQAAGAYIDLVALERLADAGTTEALDRAAAIGQSAQFARIRDALLRAELAGRPSWSGLTELADETGVMELADLADIMRVAGHDGAAVYTTLRARAASLRTQLLTAATSEANAASEHMVVPASLLGLCFMALLAYPALVRIMFG